VLIISGASENLKKNRVAQRQISGAKQILGKLKLPLEEKVKYYSSFSTGSQINIIAELENTVFGANDLGKLGKSAEQVGKEAAQNFLKEVQSEACLDKYVADQILPYMALAQERSEVTVSEITSHCQTNIWLIEKFLDGKFKIEGNKISWLPK
jgi:RNA 3'-terminal phosphate cyclase